MSRAPWIERSAGVLLHVSSLPSGRIDEDAMRFAGLLAEAGMRIWQILPVGPLDAHGSPYQPSSAFAGNERLLPAGFAPAAAEVAAYVEDNADWLPDYALFTALEREMGHRPWYEWPAELRDRDPAALAEARAEHAEEIEQVERTQCAFDLAWSRFKAAVNRQGLLLFGDVPLFLAHQSADVWEHRQLFEVDEHGRSLAFMGVPPDAFSAEGQWWGYPPYRWDAMAAEDYRWWRRRFEIQSRRFDLVRLDHFRGFAGFWRIPCEARSARDGAWVTGPGRAAIDALAPVLHGTRLVAEDLGHITQDVVDLRDALGIPGMRVLQFGFDGDPRNPHLPAQHTPDVVCYTGTHDNDTTLGWWQSLHEGAQHYVRHALGCGDTPMPQALVEAAWASPAPLSIVPMQDLLNLDARARMNVPGVESGNWQWRFAWHDLPPGFATGLRSALTRHGRLNPLAGC